MILSLANELLHRIVSWLELDDLKRTRFTCKHLNYIVTPLVLEHVALNLNDEMLFPVSMSLLQSLGSRKDNPGRYIKSLRINSSFDPPYGRYIGFWDKVANRRARVTSLIATRLLEAIPSLVCLRSLHFLGFHQGGFSTLEVDAVMRQFSKLPHLSTISIILHTDTVHESFFSHFHNLRDITFNGHRVLDVIPSLIASSPDIYRLDLVNFSASNAVFPSVRDIFSSLPPATCRPVEHLSIEGQFMLPPSDVTFLIPHLRLLASLQIHIANVPEQLWTALRTENIFLHHISVVMINDALVEYLGSYSGIMTLSLTPTQPDSDARAQRFWKTVLPKHVRTMKELFVHPNTAGEWCLNDGALRILTQCKNLEILRVIVDQDRVDVKGPDNIITRLLECLRPWEHLQSLSILSAHNPNDFGGSALLPSYRICQRIQKLITEYQCCRPTEGMLRLAVATDYAESVLVRRELEIDVFSFLATQSWGIGSC
ncbi:uncharacterized protein BT62DRAFT_460014 [Guyanagaster necrorhizus]|uniref:F-box domain-containing protein n=1 Tax=Guyanagaster necrorhizus TaxID=856835 RepID=A0A9P7VIX0_9AGAR|nr:uncharacterized protein BT62DRAFT_460014 [Guyanagaster necrorhizus MCA 3950]KAG7441931.1 hypothetical protein BT62DRAFT_460014 [Guyanagaster necrorhizus MCA 3950]